MLLSQNLINEALWKASSTGADYAEIYAEYTSMVSGTHGENQEADRGQSEDDRCRC